MTTFSGEVHALAARWPLMPDDELDALAASIAADGLQHPIVIDNQGRLVDGRNRLEACHRAKVSPTYVTPADLNDDESVRRWIHRANGQRRNVSTGQKAMEYADLLASEGKRKNGRWVRGSVVTDVRNTGDRTWIDAMRQAGLVLDYRPDLVDPDDLALLGRESAINRATVDRADDAVQRGVGVWTPKLRMFANYRQMSAQVAS